MTFLVLFVFFSSSSKIILQFNKKLLSMSIKKYSQYYNTPLNLSQTIDLPSNLLQGRPGLRPSYKSSQIPNQNPSPMGQSSTIGQLDSLSPPNLSALRSNLHNLQGKKSENMMLIQQKSKQRKNVLYKRLSDIKGQNKELEKYSYSKLLSKMVVSDPDEQQKSFNHDPENTRTISEYSCLRGKLLSMDQMNESTIPINLPSNFRNGSGCSSYNSRTTRIFKRYYMPSTQKGKTTFFNQPVGQQKYIYINGKKTECKRIHNFYTSQNFRNSYDKAFGKTKDSFYSSASRYDKDI